MHEDQGLREERLSALLVYAALLRRLLLNDADPALLALLDETESALDSLLGGSSPAQVSPDAGLFLLGKKRP